MIKITSANTALKTLRPSDPDFVINSGLVVTPRAGFEISDDCPYNHLQILKTCIDRGWIKPVAHMRDTEYTMELLRK